MEAAVVDTSVFADYFLLFEGNRERHVRARQVLDLFSEKGVRVYVPFLCEVELKGVLVRHVEPARVIEIVNRVMDFVNVFEESALRGLASEVALHTGSRAVDSYFIALSRLVEASLVTSDRVMKANAARFGVRSYYILDPRDFSSLLEGLA